MEKFQDLYEILGINRNASKQEIRKAYVTLGKKYHPDSYPNISEEKVKEIEEKFKEVSNAYSILNDEVKKIDYDRKYDANKEREKARKQATQQTQYHSSTTSDKTKTHTQSKTQESTTYNSADEKTESTEETFASRMKEAYKEVRKEEIKYSFIKRHKMADKKLYEEEYDEDFSEEEVMKFQFMRGTLHVFGELAYQLKKLKYQQQETIQKYVLRNRYNFTCILLAIVLATSLGVSNNNNSNGDFNDTGSITGTEDLDDYRNTIYAMYRTYTVKPGDTLSQLAVDSNCSVKTIENMNDIGDFLLAGKTITIPYIRREEDLKYCTASVEKDRNMTLEEFATMYSTNVETIIRLNEEAIQEINDSYHVFSDTLVVPTFETTTQINQIKQQADATKTYQKN